MSGYRRGGALNIPLATPLGEETMHKARRTCAVFAHDKAELLLFLGQCGLLPEREGGDSQD